MTGSLACLREWLAGLRPAALYFAAASQRALLLACVVGPSHAAAPQDELQKYVENVGSLSASFEQVQKDEDGKVLQKLSGKLWLARPGKFRWAYEKPYQQLMICDGETLWLYDPDLAQVTVRPAGATLQGTPAQLLTGQGAVERHFKVEDAGTDAGARRFRLLPKAKDGDFQSVELWLRDGAPARMRFVDPLGGVNEVSFTQIRKNAAVERSVFTFEIPKGVEVIQAQ